MPYNAWDELSRRRWFSHMGTAVAGIAVGDLLGRDLFAARASGQPYDVNPRPAMFLPRARRVIQLFMHGGIWAGDDNDHDHDHLCGW